MRRSKFIFYLIAGIILIAVVLLVAVNPGKHTSEPTNPSAPPTGGTLDYTTPSNPQETNLTQPSSSPTEAPSGPTDQPTVPSDTPPELYPTEPKSPLAAFRPEEVTHDKLPQTSGAHYMNHGTIATEVVYKNRRYMICFGLNAGIQNYIYLNPVVIQTDGPEYGPDNFQFTFTPSRGYVTTITNVDSGDYMSDEGSTTFMQALDWGLPSSYINEEFPGTVWYREDHIVPTAQGMHVVYVDVRVYANGEFLATLKLQMDPSIDGTYYMTQCGNMNQLEMNAYFSSLNHKMTDAQISALIEQAKTDASQERDGHYLYPEEVEALKTENFIIEWRETGKGTYFDYTCDISSQFEFYPKAEFTGTPLVAVSIRTTHLIYRAPMTLYYKVVTNFDNTEEYELVAIETYSSYYKRSLYYSDYPGYSEPSD